MSCDMCERAIEEGEPFLCLPVPERPGEKVNICEGCAERMFNEMFPPRQ